jgi:hypothetical protein
MTKKDFVLIQDAINEGVKKFLTDPAVRNTEAASPMNERRLRLALSEKFADKLKYTNNEFKSDIFRKGVDNTKLARNNLQALAE